MSVVKESFFEASFKTIEEFDSRRGCLLQI